MKVLRRGSHPPSPDTDLLDAPVGSGQYDSGMPDTAEATPAFPQNEPQANALSPVDASSVHEFIRVLRQNFIAAMGGGVSVLGTLVAAFVPKIPSPWIVGVTAVICGVLSAYAIWAKERNERVGVETRLRPALRVLLGGGGPQYMQLVTADDNATPTNEYHRLVLINTGADPVHDVRVYLQALNGSDLSFGPLELIPMHGHINRERPVTAFHDVPVAFDLVEHGYNDNYFSIPCREQFIRLPFEHHEIRLKVTGTRGTTITQHVAIDARDRNRIAVALLDKPSGEERRLTPVGYGEWRAKDEVLEENKRLRAELAAIQPRRLTSQQRDQLRNALTPITDVELTEGREHGRQVSVFWTGAGDCADYARQFEDLFADIGLRLHMYSRPQYEREFHYGIWIIWNSDYEKRFRASLGQGLCDALALAGIDFRSIDTTDVRVAQLVVGARRL